MSYGAFVLTVSLLLNAPVTDSHHDVYTSPDGTIKIENTCNASVQRLP